MIGQPKNVLERLLTELRESSIAPGMTLSEGQESLDLKQLTNYFNCIPSLFSIYLNRGNRFVKYYNNDFLSYNRGKSPIEMFIRDIKLKEQKGLDVLNLSSYMFCKSTLPGYILSTIGDKVEMANSIEGRVPFLDSYSCRICIKVTNKT